MPHAIESPPDLLPGTPDMPILRTLARSPNQGYGIAQSIRTLSGGPLIVGEGSLYPVLQRILITEWATAEWSVSETTSAGFEQLAGEVKRYDFMIAALGRVMEGV